MPGERHQDFAAHPIGKDGMGDDLDLRHGAAEFQQAARHVVVGGHQPQGMKPLRLHPGGGLRRIAQRAVGGIAGEDAAGQQLGRGLLRLGRQGGDDVGQMRAGIDPGDEELVRQAVVQQADAFGQTLAAPGHHDDGVGMPVGLLRVAGQAGDEDHEAGEPEEGQQQQETEEAPHDGLSGGRPSSAGASRCAATQPARSSWIATGSTWRGRPAAWVARPLPLRTSTRAQPAASGGLEIDQAIPDHDALRRRYPELGHGFAQHARRGLAPRSRPLGMVGAMDQRVEPGAGAGELVAELVVDMGQHRLVDDAAAHHALIGADDDQAAGLVQARHRRGGTRQQHELRRGFDRIRTVEVQHPVAIEQYQPHGLTSSWHSAARTV